MGVARAKLWRTRMSHIVGFSLAPFILLWVSCPLLVDQEDGKSIIDKAVDAVGGEAKLAKFNACSWTQTYHVWGAETPEMTKHYFEWPGRFRGEYGAAVEVLNGDKYWTKEGNVIRE